MSSDYRIFNYDSAKKVSDLVLALNTTDKQWTVTVKRYQKKRSLPQNNLMWKWYTIIGDHLGYTKDEMHDVLREMFLPWEDVTILGIKKRVLTSTSSESFTVAMESEYLDRIDRFAAGELGIILPHPQDDFYESLPPSRSNE